MVSEPIRSKLDDLSVPYVLPNNASLLDPSMLTAFREHMAILCAVYDAYPIYDSLRAFATDEFERLSIEAVLKGVDYVDDRYNDEVAHWVSEIELEFGHFSDSQNDDVDLSGAREHERERDLVHGQEQPKMSCYIRIKHAEIVKFPPVQK